MDNLTSGKLLRLKETPTQGAEPVSDCPVDSRTLLTDLNESALMIDLKDLPDVFVHSEKIQSLKIDDIKLQNLAGALGEYLEDGFSRCYGAQDGTLVLCSPIINDLGDRSCKLWIVNDKNEISTVACSWNVRESGQQDKIQVVNDILSSLSESDQGGITERGVKFQKIDNSLDAYPQYSFDLDLQLRKCGLKEEQIRSIKKDVYLPVVVNRTPEEEKTVSIFVHDGIEKVLGEHSGGAFIQSISDAIKDFDITVENGITAIYELSNLSDQEKQLISEKLDRADYDEIVSIFSEAQNIGSFINLLKSTNYECSDLTLKLFTDNPQIIESIAEIGLKVDELVNLYQNEEKSEVVKEVIRYVGSKEITSQEALDLICKTASENDLEDCQLKWLKSVVCNSHTAVIQKKSEMLVELALACADSIYDHFENSEIEQFLQAVYYKPEDVKECIEHYKSCVVEDDTYSFGGIEDLFSPTILNQIGKIINDGNVQSLIVYNSPEGNVSHSAWVDLVAGLPKDLRPSDGQSQYTSLLIENSDVVLQVKQLTEDLGLKQDLMIAAVCGWMKSGDASLGGLSLVSAIQIDDWEMQFKPNENTGRYVGSDFAEFCRCFTRDVAVPELLAAAKANDVTLRVGDIEKFKLQYQEALMERVVVESKSASDLFESKSQWVDQIANGVQRDILLNRDTNADSTSDLSWPKLLSDFQITEDLVDVQSENLVGYHIEFPATSEELKQQGDVFENCVGWNGYDSLCYAGDNYIGILKDRDKNPIACIHFAKSGDRLVVKEALGPNNDALSAENQRAIQIFLGHFNSSDPGAVFEERASELRQIKSKDDVKSFCSDEILFDPYDKGAREQVYNTQYRHFLPDSMSKHSLSKFIERVKVEQLVKETLKDHVPMND